MVVDVGNSRVCSWKRQWLFDNWLRKLAHPHEKVLGPYVDTGMRVVDIGCGTGYFSLCLARLVGPAGRVLSLDVQPQALERLEMRAARAGLDEIIETRVCASDSLGRLQGMDFALAFWMVHEAPDVRGLFCQLFQGLKHGGRLLVAEPPLHISRSSFERELDLACEVGFTVQARPAVFFARAALLEKA